MKLHGSGFIVSAEEAQALGFGKVAGLEKHIRPYRNGKDLMDIPRGVFVLDFYGSTAEQIRDEFPTAYQWLLDRVKPERDQNTRESRRKNWWLFAESVPKLRKALMGHSRYIVTCRTAKHRVFQFLDVACLPDSKVIAVASEDSLCLGVLSTRIHGLWAIKAGSFLGVGNDSNYNNTECFGKFPFPDPTPAQRTRIATLAEQLDAHRKRQ